LFRSTVTVAAAIALFLLLDRVLELLLAGEFPFLAIVANYQLLRAVDHIIFDHQLNLGLLLRLSLLFLSDIRYEFIYEILTFVSLPLSPIYF